MRYKRFLIWLVTVCVLSILMTALPAAPVLAAEAMVLSPAQGKIGDKITYNVSGYTIGGTNDYYLDIYVSDQAAVYNNVIDSAVTRYKKVVFGSFIDETGACTGYFNFPTTLNEGVVGTASPLTLTSGTTYYVYATSRYYDPALPGKVIKAIATFTVTPGATLNPLSPASGPGGTSVSISGVNFSAGNIAVTFDGSPVSITGGSTQTVGGSFICNITVPAAAAVGAHTIGVTVGADTAQATFTVTASGTLDPLQPASGAAGIDIIVSGSNFAPSTAIIFKFDTTQLTPKSGTQTGSGGSFSSIITIPTSAQVGAHKIYVTVGTITANKDFTVTSAAPTTTPPTTTPPTTTPPTTTPPPTSSKAAVNIVQNSQAVGATVGIGGTGFTPGATVSIKWNDKEVGSVKASSDTTFQYIFKVPAGAHGDQKITISDGTNVVTKTFTVETTPPKVPQPVKPQLGAKVKSPVLFDWQEVTDDSLPVTYRLQIATDKSFGAGTIVVDKSGLDTSSYTLTDAEEKALAGQDTPYYWRVKSIDAAANESEWTGAGEFYISGPFVFPRWALILVIVGGAIVMFLIGLWVGRRTAFYY
jgi:hypothetical protein